MEAEELVEAAAAAEVGEQLGTIFKSFEPEFLRLNINRDDLVVPCLSFLSLRMVRNRSGAWRNGRTTPSFPRIRPR